MDENRRKLITDKKKDFVSCSIVYRDGKYTVVDETDFWRRGIMKELPVLGSLTIVAFIGIILAVLFK